MKALGIALMCSRNPKESDTEKSLKDMFLRDSSISEDMKNETGFHFQTALIPETEAH